MKTKLSRMSQLLMKGRMLLVIVLFFSVGLFLLTPKPAKAAPFVPATFTLNSSRWGIIPSIGGDKDLQWDHVGPGCDWKNASAMVCDDFIFAFDAPASIDNGHAVFKLVRQGGWLGAKFNGMDALRNDSSDPTHNNGSQDWYIHLTTQTDSGFMCRERKPVCSLKTDDITSDNQSAKKMLLGITEPWDSSVSDKMNQLKPTGTDTTDETESNSHPDSFLRAYKGRGVYSVCGLYAKDGWACWSWAANAGAHFDGSGLIDISDPGHVLDAIKKTLFDYMASRDRCSANAGNLGFILCPILQTSQDAVSSLIGSDGSGSGFLVELMTVSPLRNSVTDTGNNNNIYKVWAAFRDIALGMYILIFIGIIFGNGFGLDPYTIKRALPRLAAAVVFTYASFFILQTLVDLSNAIGNAIPALIETITKTSGISGFKISLNAASAGLTIVLALIVAFAALIALLIGIAGLVARQMIIYILVLVSPLAFAAWVLPNTESLFKKWWSNLIKVLMMFPIIAGMLAISLLYQKSVDGSQSLAVQISGLLAPMIALIFIPKTFKWGGDLFVAGASFLAGRATKATQFGKGVGQKGGQALKTGAQNRILQSEKPLVGGNSRLGGFLAGAGIGSLADTRGARLRKAGKITKLQGDIEKSANLRYDQAMTSIAPKNDAIGRTDQVVDKEKMQAFQKLVTKAPREERFAYAAKAAQSGNLDHVGLAASGMTPQDYNQMVSRNYSAFDGIPDMRNYDLASKRGAVTKAVAGPGYNSADYVAANNTYRNAVAGEMGRKSSGSIASAKPGAQNEMFYTKDTAGNEVFDQQAINGTIDPVTGIRDPKTGINVSQLQNLVTDKTSRGQLTSKVIKALDDYATLHITSANPEMQARAAAIRAGIDTGGTFRP